MRWAVLGLLLPALVAAPAPAFCADCADDGCCCAKQRGCCKPVRPETPRAKCCDGGASQASVPVATPTFELLPSTAAPDGPSAEAVPVEDRFRETSDAPGAGAFPVALYTLHAAFLI
jgi:hypothetical protein